MDTVEGVAVDTLYEALLAVKRLPRWFEDGERLAKVEGLVAEAIEILWEMYPHA